MYALIVGGAVVAVKKTGLQKDETPIRKSIGVTLGERSDFESPPAFPNLHRTSLAGSFELGGAHTGIGWPTGAIVSHVSKHIKRGVKAVYRESEAQAPWAALEETSQLAGPADVPMPFDGDVLEVRILAKQFVDPQQGNRLYLVEAMEIETPASFTGESGSSEEVRSPHRPAGINHRFTQMVAAVNGDGASKVTDPIFHRKLVFRGRVSPVLDRPCPRSRDCYFAISNRFVHESISAFVTSHPHAPGKLAVTSTRCGS